ncbi:12131_t:CDS:2 [Racocetra persica]|uniref:12131_t:CDS:1 n=1 Tax=Racocetra persica TaxID=160502 RepID=A0ACA9L6A2_9GLOM|nr:12131_t:CDS:2 [Racocetra persica]
MLPILIIGPPDERLKSPLDICKELLQAEGLKAKIATWLSIAEPENLDLEIQGARKIKAKEYYNTKASAIATYVKARPSQTIIITMPDPSTSTTSIPNSKSSSYKSYNTACLDPSLAQRCKPHETKVRALGRITNLKLDFENIVILITFQGEVLLVLSLIFVELEVLEELEDLGLFDNFEFEDEILKEAEEYLAKQCNKLELYENL